MKVIKIPIDEDPFLNRIDSLKNILVNDTDGEYLDEIILVLINHIRSIDDESDEIRFIDAKLTEARFWCYEFFPSGKEENSDQAEK